MTGLPISYHQGDGFDRKLRFCDLMQNLEFKIHSRGVYWTLKTLKALKTLNLENLTLKTLRTLKRLGFSLAKP